MTLKEAIDALDALAPNAYTAAQKTGWLNELAGRIQTELWLLPGFEAVRYDYDAEENAALLPLPGAYEGLWVAWLRAQVDFADGEFDRYADSRAVYNELSGSYLRWFARVYDPAARVREPLSLLGTVLPTQSGLGAQTLCALPAGAFLGRLVCRVEEAFPAGAALTLGTVADGAALFAAGAIDPCALGETVRCPALTGACTLTSTLADGAGAGRAAVYGRVWLPLE